MSALEAVNTYYGLFGLRGVALAAAARLRDARDEIAARAPGLKLPVHLRLRTSDVSVFRQVLITREYDWEFSKTPRVIIDAGANIGLTSVFYANKYPEATIVAIEPEPSNFQMLEKNIEPYPNVTAVHAALWKANEEISLIDPGLGCYGFRTIGASDLVASPDGQRRVRGLTVDEVMKTHGLEFVDLLKIDIESSEKEVFEGATGWIERVGVIVVELHDQLRSGCARSVYLAAKDFEFEWRKGETVFLAKREYAANCLPLRGSQLGETEATPDSASSAVSHWKAPEHGRAPSDTEIHHRASYMGETAHRAGRV